MTASWQNQQNGKCAKRRLRSAWASAESDQGLRCPHDESYGSYLPIERTAKTLIRLGAQSFCWFCHEAAQMVAAFRRTVSWYNKLNISPYFTSHGNTLILCRKLQLGRFLWLLSSQFCVFVRASIVQLAIRIVTGPMVAAFRRFPGSIWRYLSWRSLCMTATDMTSVTAVWVNILKCISCT